jgi:tRNA-Thr(GGU) m(6)t(6)A37 methyltransferase TsaA
LKILAGTVIGMRAVVSDFSEVGAGAIIGEMGLVKNGQKVPAGKVAVGIPVEVIGDVDDRHRSMPHWAKDLYASLAQRYAAGGLVELEPRASAIGKLPSLVSIGTIHTPYSEATGTPIQGALAGDAKGEIRLLPHFHHGLSDLEGFSHIIVLYAFHRSEGYSLKVTPYLDSIPRGLFATRSPRRPNPIGITVLRLLDIKGGRLEVSGVDMLDGTPLLDIKPFVPKFDGRQGARIGWLGPRLQELEDGDAAPLGK